MKRRHLDFDTLYLPTKPVVQANLQYSGMVISILTVWECDENSFQSSKSIFLGTRGFSLKFERSENFKEAPSCPEKCFYKTEK